MMSFFKKLIQKITGTENRQKQEQKRREEQERHERAQKIADQIEKDLKDAGCYEIYQEILQSIHNKDEEKLSHIMKTAPEFNMDLLTPNGSTILTEIADHMPRISNETLELVLNRHPNPLKRNFVNETAHDILQRKINLYHSSFYHNKEISQNIYYIGKLNQRLHEYKIEYATYVAVKDRTARKNSPLYVPEWEILFALSQPAQTICSGNTIPPATIVIHPDINIWPNNDRERVN